MPPRLLPRLPESGSSDHGTGDSFDRAIEHIVAKTERDPSYPFQPNVVRLIAEMKRKGRVAFERLRERLRAIGFKRLTQLDKEVDEEIKRLEEKEETAEQRDVDALLRTARAEVALFRTPDGLCYADVRMKRYRGTYALRGRGFKRCLRYLHRMKTGGSESISDSALSQVIADLEADAFYGEQEREVFVRVAQDGDGTLYIDLGDETWRAIAIDETGWRVDPEPPVRFRRSAGMLPLPVPERGGDIADLFPFLNLNERDRSLYVAYAQTAMRPMRNYPVMPMTGEQGVGKTTLCEIMRGIVDPAKPATAGFPRSEEDLVIHANNAHLLVFDNVSSLQSWQSDALCRISTGAGFHKRQLFSDADEWSFGGCRPVMLNGITEVVSRADLMDRSVMLVPETIAAGQRATKEEFWATFERERPRILGAFFDSLSDGLKRLPSVRLRHRPRMLDFAQWGVACEPHNPPIFEDAYAANQDAMATVFVETDAVAKAVLDWVEKWPKAKLSKSDTAAGFGTSDEGLRQWRGYATVLHARLESFLGPEVLDKLNRDKRWPRTPHGLSGRLSRAAPNLRKFGIDIKRDKLGGRERLITIIVAAEAAAKPAKPTSGKKRAKGKQRAKRAERGDDAPRAPRVDLRGMRHKPGDGDAISDDDDG